MRYIGGGIGHKSTWNIRTEHTQQQCDSESDCESDGQEIDEQNRVCVPESGEGDLDDLEEEDHDSDGGDNEGGSEGEAYDYGYVPEDYDEDDSDVADNDGEGGNSDDSLGPEDGEQNWEDDEWGVDGYAPF
jgi:hypothetical protein